MRQRCRWARCRINFDFVYEGGGQGVAALSIYHLPSASKFSQSFS